MDVTSQSTPVKVRLVDAFETGKTRVVKPVNYCLPVDKNGEGISNSDDILVCYSITSAHASPQRTVPIADQLGPKLKLTTGQPETLCVPSKRIR